MGESTKEQHVPVRMEETVWLVGECIMTTLTRIVFPLRRPGLAVAFICVFIGA